MNIVKVSVSRRRFKGRHGSYGFIGSRIVILSGDYNRSDVSNGCLCLSLVVWADNVGCLSSTNYRLLIGGVVADAASNCQCLIVPGFNERWRRCQ